MKLSTKIRFKQQIAQQPCVSRRNAGQGAAAGGGIVDCRGERMAAWVHHRLQHALRPSPGECQEPAPAKAGDLHRPLAQADDLDEILAWREESTVTRNLTLHYDRMMLLLE